MYKYFIVFNGETNLDHNVFISSRVTKPSTELECEEVIIPGGETLYREKGYKDIEITVPFNFSTDKDKWEQHFRSIKKWLNSKGKVLKFSDDLEVFYKVKKIRIDIPERVLKKIGRFNVIFTCSPYIYYSDGSKEVELGNTLYNDGIESRPIYRIVGEGYMTLGVNGKQVNINVGQELIIDTELGLCFRKGIPSNVSLQGSYKDLYLKEDDNTFEYPSNFKVYVIPNWRCLS